MMVTGMKFYVLGNYEKKKKKMLITLNKRYDLLRVYCGAKISPNFLTIGPSKNTDINEMLPFLYLFTLNRISEEVVE